VTSLWHTTRSPSPQSPSRSAWPSVGLDQWAQQLAQWFTNGGVDYGYIGGGTLNGNEEPIEPNFLGYVQGAYKANGVVFACMLARMLLFSEARFQFRQRRAGRPGDLFGTGDLSLLEVPWRNGTTGGLLSRMIQDVDLAGNFFGARRPGPQIARMRPDRVTIVLGSRTGREIDNEVVGYAYDPTGTDKAEDIEIFLPEGVAHFAPIPDPEARFRGMSWLTPILREIEADSAATTHKAKFFVNGATPNMVVTLGDQVRMTPEVFENWIAKFESQHEGVMNAYKTLYLAAGADAKVVGSDMKQVDFKVTQGAGETRIAAAAGVPPVIVGLSEGLQGSSLNAGNFGAAKRRFGDMTMRPLWREAAASLAPLVTVPAGAELWYDDRDIPALQEDMKDAAEVQQLQAITIRELINAGYEPKSVIDAVNSQDWARLTHTGLVSVQLQAPGADPGTDPSANGTPVAPAAP
jgi:phage portal protein BeeE